MTQSLPRQLKVRRYLNLKAMLFGVCVLNILVSLIHVQRVEHAAQAAFAAGHWGYAEHWSPVAVMWEPLLLLVSVLGLLVNRWWSLLLSLVVSARVVYLSGYLSWLSIHNAHDVPMFSWQALEKLWFAVYQPHPQYLFEVIVGGCIFVYSMLLFIQLRKESSPYLTAHEANASSTTEAR